MSVANSFLETRANGRNVVIAFVFAAIFFVLSRVVLARLFHDYVGLLPFDLQFPLRREGIAIQLGAYNRPLAERAYVPFVIADTGLALTLAWAIALLWQWIFIKSPNRLFSFLNRGGILLVPVAAGLLDICENVAFYRLIHGIKGQGYGDTIEFAANTHALKAALGYVREHLTGAIAFIGLLTLWLRRRTGGKSD